MTKPIRYTEYTKRRLAKRQIPEAEVERAIREPDRAEPGRPPRQIHMRTYHDARLGKDVLLRVVVEATIEEIVVVTVYYTTDLDRYGKGNTP